MPILTIEDAPDLFLPNEGGQSGFMDDYTHRYCALAGGWFAGKTWAGARKLADLHLYNAFDQDEKPTRVKSAAIAPTYQLAQDFIVPELRLAFEEMNLSYRFVADPRRYCFVLPDLGTATEPSEILIRTADSPERITGWTVGAIWGDEVARWKVDDTDPQGDPFLQADARLRDPRARFLQFIMTFTHEGDGTRVYRDFEEDPKPDHAIYRAGTFENPHARDFAAVQRQQLTPLLAGQYLDGRAVAFGGSRMYGSFDYNRNIDDGLRLVPEMPLQVALDFNIEPGMHCIVGQHWPQEDLLTSVHEIHEPRMTVKRLAVALRELIEGLGGWQWPGGLQIFGDSTGQSKWAGVGDSCYEVLCESLRLGGVPYQMRVPKMNPNVTDRANAVNCALCDLSGRVRYRIHPRCARLIADYRTMKWNTAGEPDKRDRSRSHASDADGYRVFWLMPIRKVVRVVGSVSVMTAAL